MGTRMIMSEYEIVKNYGETDKKKAPDVGAPGAADLERCPNL